MSLSFYDINELCGEIRKAIDAEREKNQDLENVSIELDELTVSGSLSGGGAIKRTACFSDSAPSPDIRVIEYLKPSDGVGVSCPQPTIMWLCNEKRASSSKIEHKGDRLIQKRIKDPVTFHLHLPPHSLKDYDGGVVLIQLGYKGYSDAFWGKIAPDLVCIVQQSEMVREWLANQDKELLQSSEERKALVFRAPKRACAQMIQGEENNMECDDDPEAEPDRKLCYRP